MKNNISNVSFGNEKVKYRLGHGAFIIVILKRITMFNFFLDKLDNGYARSWNLSMEQCRKSRHSGYLLGDVILNNPRLVCREIQSHSVIWVGVRRQKYKNVDQGIYKYLIHFFNLLHIRENYTFMQMNVFRLFALTQLLLGYDNIIIHHTPPLKKKEY